MSKPGTDECLNNLDDLGRQACILRNQNIMKAYRNAIRESEHLFKNKIVLDVGCGNGILSLFAAKAGAAKVFGLETTGMGKYTKKVIEDNGYSDVITVISGQIDKVDIPVKEVDVILSFWVGKCIFYKSLIGSVIYARDKWLKKGGKIFPDKAALFVCGYMSNDFENKSVKLYKNIYGFDMSHAKEAFLYNPLNLIIPKDAVITTPCLVTEVDLYAQHSDLYHFMNPIYITAKKDSSIHGIAVYFSVYFSDSIRKNMFTTSPDNEEPTPWNQTIFRLKEEIKVKKGDVIKGSLEMVSQKQEDLELLFTLRIQFVKEDFYYNEIMNYKLGHVSHRY